MNKNNYQCVRYTWNGERKQLKQEFAVFSGKYYLSLSIEGFDKKSQEIVTFLGDEKNLYMWMQEADLLDLIKRGRIFDLGQMRELYGVDIARKVFIEEDASVFENNSFSCSSLEEKTKLKFELPPLPEVEFNMADWEQQESLFSHNDKNLSVDVLLAGFIAESYRYKFKSQSSNACINFMNVCFRKDHIQFSDLQNSKKKEDYSLLDEQSFEVLSENCGPNREGSFNIRIKGKDQVRGSDVICDDSFQRSFFPDQPRDKKLHNDFFLGLSDADDARMTKLEGSYRCVSEDIDSFAQSKKTIFVSDGRIMMELLLASKGNIAIHKLIYTNGSVYYFDASSKPIDEELYVWSSASLKDRYNFDLSDASYMRRYIHSKIGSATYSCSSWQVDNDVFTIPKMQEAPADFPTYPGNEGRLFNI